MGPRLVRIRGGVPDPADLAPVARHLVGGGLVAMPTETVYGFGCVPYEAPVRTLQRLKGRGPEKPFLLLIPGVDSVPELDWVPRARALAELFWPGALTLILMDPAGRYPSGVRSPAGGVAVRVSPHPLVKALVRSVGGPIVSTSANTPGGLPALTPEGAMETAEGLGAGDELWVLDGGPLIPSEPSTIIDCTGSVPLIRRVGAIPLDRIRFVLPEIHEPS
ncbi:MAG: L-threonylcarbamoyladenylate synthase [Gemmatimonadota bacterium]